jgi:O-antigen ligase
VALYSSERSSKGTTFPLYYFIIAGGGLVFGLITCIASEMQLKWFIVYIFAILLLTTFTLVRERRKLALGLFVLFITFLVQKRIYYTEYPLIAGGRSSFGVFLYDIPLIYLFFHLAGEKVLNRDTSIYIPPILMPFIIYVLWSGISIINATEPELTILEFIWLAKMAIILLLVANLIKDRKDLILVISVLVFGLFLQEIITFAQAHLGRWLTFTGDVEHTTLSSTTRPGTFRAGGTVGVHNIQAAYYVLLISLTAAISFIIKDWKFRYFMFFIIFLGVCAIIITYSRNGYLSLFAGLTVVGVLAWKMGYVGGKHFIVAGWIIVASLFIVLPFIGGETVFQRIRSKAAIKPRIESTRFALNMIKKHPIAGVGLNNFAIVMGDKDYSPQGVSESQQGYFGGKYIATVVHNRYLLVASETGLIGLGSFLWMLYIAYAYTFKLLSSRDRLFWGIGAGMLGALVGASVNMLFDIYNSDLLITVLWVIVGVTFAAHKIRVEEEKRCCHT